MMRSCWGSKQRCYILNISIMPWTIIMKWWGLVASTIYTTLTCIIWYCGLKFPILCILIHSATCYCIVCTYAGHCRVITVDKIVQTVFPYKIFLVLIMYMFGTLSGHVGLCLDYAWLYILSSNCSNFIM